MKKRNDKILSTEKSDRQNPFRKKKAQHLENKTGTPLPSVRYCFRAEHTGTCVPAYKTEGR